MFIFRIWQLCLVYWDLEIWGSTTATIWRSAAVQQEGSYTPRPTTGCFSINKDFLLSAEVPTDAFIGAKFTLCTRRELPLCCSEWRQQRRWSFFMSELLVGFSKQRQPVTAGGHSALWPQETVGLDLKLNDRLVVLKCANYSNGLLSAFWDFTAACLYNPVARVHALLVMFFLVMWGQCVKVVITGNVLCSHSPLIKTHCSIISIICAMVLLVEI